MSTKEVFQIFVDKGYPCRETDRGIEIASKGDYPNVPRGSHVGVVCFSGENNSVIDRSASQYHKLSEDIENILAQEGFTDIGYGPIAA